jgi:formylmethanofuran dehydrogenase subunit D
MKIQKRFLRKYNNKDYYKYMVNIPPLVLKEAGIEYGEEVDIKAKKGKVILEKKKKEK